MSLVVALVKFFFVYMTREVAKAIKAKATANGVNKHTK